MQKSRHGRLLEGISHVTFLSYDLILYREISMLEKSSQTEAKAKHS